MPSLSKAAAAAKDRRKSDKADRQAAKMADVSPSSGLVTLTVSPERLRAIVDPASVDHIKEESPAKDAKESPATSGTLPAAPASNPENASDSAPNTPAASGTPAPQPAMGPPAEGPKKKGTKRSAAAMNANGDVVPKPRGKPGPKKKQRLEDGTMEPRPSGLGAHKLGPKANQGAINAGLRALDRSGKPCRKWAKGGFKLKSFTGVVWEIPRWTAPPKPKPAESSTQDGSAAVSAAGSSKENKESESDKLKSDNGNASGVDAEMRSAAPSINPSSPAPQPVAVAS